MAVGLGQVPIACIVALQMFATQLPATEPELQTRQSVLVELANDADRQAIVGFAGARGGFSKHEYRILPRLLNLRNLDAASVQELRKQPGVRRVIEDRPVEIMLDDSVPLVRAHRNQLESAGFQQTGSGIRVCVIDTGIAPNHALFADRLDREAGYDFINDDPHPDDRDSVGRAPGV